MATELHLDQALKERGALLDGHFRLSSGRHSNRFVQKFRVLEDPKLVEPVARAIAELFAREKPTLVVSAAVGGIVLGYEVARALGVKAIFVEKENGVPALRRGFQITPDDRVLVVEDVITTGGSVREILDVVRDQGANAAGGTNVGGGARIVGVGAIVQRGAADFGVPFRALLDLPIVSYGADECPQCKAGEPVTDPGSRRSA